MHVYIYICRGNIAKSRSEGVTFERCIYIKREGRKATWQADIELYISISWYLRGNIRGCARYFMGLVNIASRRELAGKAATSIARSPPLYPSSLPSTTSTCMLDTDVYCSTSPELYNQPIPAYPHPDQIHINPRQL